ncbi:MAG: histidine phosphatase family protein [Microscillaceae bacterium]|nr:histidine phosphatase family protein [Microscillaceae bacterium]
MRYWAFPRPQIQYSTALLELSQGEWEGQGRAEKYDEATMQRLREDVWNFKAPGGESQKEVEIRMVGFLEQLHANIKEEEARIAIVSHGLAIKCLLRGLLNFDPPMTYRTLTENTSITQVNHYANGWGLVRLNDAAHLAETGSLEQDLR